MPEVARAVTTPIRWQLTDRGIAVVLLVVAMILTAAVIAIGVTAVRVTSADFDAGLHESRQAQR
jgi:multisubunit Na+/H+ antiporter MnhC subunit